MAEVAWDEAGLERRVRIWALPVALGLMWLLVHTSPGRFLARTFLSMWLHESGHALSAWLCGFLAFPGPWFTPIAAERSRLFTILLAGVFGLAASWFWQGEKRGWAGVFAGLVLAEIFCSVVLPDRSARAFFIFMGDGGSMVLGTVLMATLWWKPAQHGWLRYGFLVLGAAGLLDPFTQWWAARTDPDQIPFGMNEGQGLSDPSHLSDDFGWPAGLIVSRYVALGVVCLLVLGAAWVFGILRMSDQGDRENA